MELNWSVIHGILSGYDVSLTCQKIWLNDAKDKLRLRYDDIKSDYIHESQYRAHEVVQGKVIERRWHDDMSN